METSNLIKALFNQTYYLQHNPDVNQAVVLTTEDKKDSVSPLTAFAHFVQFGEKEGRDPSLLFSDSYYLAHNPDVAKITNNGFQHFITYGDKEGRSPTYLFDSEYYLAKNPDVAKSGLSAFDHFLQYGENEQRSPSYLFDKSYYLTQNKDVAASHINPIEHFLTYGLSEGRVSTAFFDKDYYIAHNADVAKSGMNAFQHYLEYGQFENRAPSASFNATSYLTLNPDVAKAIQAGTIDSAIEHYILFGKAEGRSVFVTKTPSDDNDNNNHDNNNNNNGGDNTGGNNTGGGGGTPATVSPVNTISGTQTVDSGSTLALAGISVADTDSATISVTFTSSQGILSATDTVTGGVGTDGISGNDSDELTLSGTVAAINATLAAHGVSFIADDGFSGSASISMTSSDGSNTDTDTITIMVNEYLGTIMELTTDSDNLVATDTIVTFSTDQRSFDETDTLTGASGTDTLLFTDSCDITFDNMLNKTGIDVIRLSENDNNIILSNAFIQNSDNGVVEINNRTFTVTYLDTSDVAEASSVIIGGTAEVTLADDVDNKITLKDEVDTHIIDGTGNDTIIGGTGNDTIMLIGGDNSIIGGEGDDTISGDSGSLTTDNTIEGGNGHDTLLSTDLLDITTDMQISSFEEIVFGSDDSRVTLSDEFIQSAENATVYLDNGTFTISYLDTSDVADDGKVVVTGSGTVILADDVNNLVYAADDTGTSIIGGTGNDTIIGASQDDTLQGGAGEDVLKGGEGDDQFVFATLSESSSTAFDRIVDFDVTSDVINLSGLGFSSLTSETSTDEAILSFSDDGTDTIITDMNGDFMIVLTGVFTTLSSDNMIF